MALSTARMPKVRGRPPLLAVGISSVIHAHASSVRSLGYVFSFIFPFYTTHEDFSDRLLGQLPSSSPWGPRLRWHRVRRTAGPSSWGTPSNVASCWRSELGAGLSGTSSLSSRVTLGSLGVPFLAVVWRTLSMTSGKGQMSWSRLAPLCHWRHSSCWPASSTWNDRQPSQAYVQPL